MREGFQDIREGKALVKRNNEEQWRREEEELVTEGGRVTSESEKIRRKGGTKELTRAGEGGEDENKSAD